MSFSLSLSLSLSQKFHTLNDRINVQIFGKEYVSQKNYFLHRTLYYVRRYVSSSEQYDTVEDKNSVYQDMIDEIQNERRTNEYLNKNERSEVLKILVDELFDRLDEWEAMLPRHVNGMDQFLRRFESFVLSELGMKHGGASQSFHRYVHDRQYYGHKNNKYKTTRRGHVSNDFIAYYNGLNNEQKQSFLMKTLETLDHYKQLFERNEYDDDNNTTAKTRMRNDLYDTRDNDNGNVVLVYELDNNYKKNYNKNIHEFLHTVRSFVMKEWGTLHEYRHTKRKRSHTR